MAYSVQKVDVWMGTIKDRPGGLAEKLAPLSEAGANFEFVLARRDKRNTGVFFVAPLLGSKVGRVAKALGLAKSDTLQAVRVEGPDKAGLGTTITCALADAGVNLRGLSAMAIGRKCVCYVAVDSKADALKARNALKKALG
ncbi:MAG TPA: amino acid-binding protein [Candidatus Hydrogenedentes bacterium]|nr:amino acid-binding protein [Candidatus Hydrogenedentota bacterium]